MQKRSKADSNVHTSEEETSRIEMLEAQLREKEDQYLRALADFDNYRKRVSREGDSITKARLQELFLELLQVHDSFDRAFQSEALRADSSVYQGLRSIQRQVFQLLEKNGVMSFETIGQPFDPAFHEAVGTELSERFTEGTIVREVQRGYLWEGKVLRAAKVVVAKKGPGSPLIDQIA